jgi:uncharacterized metal-binding protein
MLGEEGLTVTGRHDSFVSRMRARISRAGAAHVYCQSAVDEYRAISVRATNVPRRPIGVEGCEISKLTSRPSTAAFMNSTTSVFIAEPSP